MKELDNIEPNKTYQKRISGRNVAWLTQYTGEAHVNDAITLLRGKHGQPIIIADKDGVRIKSEAPPKPEPEPSGEDNAPQTEN